MSDEWIKITDSMPPIDKEIELLSLSKYSDDNWNYSIYNSNEQLPHCG